MFKTTLRPRAIDANSVRQDILAGIVVGVIALPLSLALAVAVGAPPITGLYTATFAGAIASIFGGSRFNITGPTAALVPLLGHVVTQHGVEALPMVGFLAGILLLLLRVFRVGGLIRFIPLTVVVGFTAGIALSIAFGQANNLLGITGTDPSLEYFHEKLLDSIENRGTADGATIAVGLASLALLFTWARLPRVRLVPGALVAVLLLTGITVAFDIETATLGSRYGDLPSQIPTPSLSFFEPSLIIDLLPSAISIAILASVESLLSAVVADSMARAPKGHDPDREIFGQGLANLISPIMGGIPATAAIARTAAGIRSGGTSRLVGVTHSVTVLAFTLLLGPLASNVPLSVLAAILVFTAWNIADVPELKALVGGAPRRDVAILLLTIAITLFLDLTYAIAFGVLATAFLLIHELVRLPGAKELTADETGRIREVSPELADLMKSRTDIAFFTAQGVLSFQSVATFEHYLNADTSKPVILRMKDLHHIDTTGLMTLRKVIEHRQRHGSRILLSAIPPEILPSLERFGIIDMIGTENVFPETRLAVAAVTIANAEAQESSPDLHLLSLDPAQA